MIMPMILMVMIFRSHYDGGFARIQRGASRSSLRSPRTAFWGDDDDDEEIPIFAERGEVQNKKE